MCKACRTKKTKYLIRLERNDGVCTISGRDIRIEPGNNFSDIARRDALASVDFA
jgi:hypothetical protein